MQGGGSKKRVQGGRVGEGGGGYRGVEARSCRPSSQPVPLHPMMC